MAKPFQFPASHHWSAFLICCLLIQLSLVPIADGQALNEDYLPESDFEAMLLSNDQVEKAKLSGSFEPKNYGLFSYVSGNKSAGRAIVYLYDHQGFSENNLRNADALASDGSLFVVMPDVEGFKAFSESKPISPNEGRKFIVCMATKRCREKEPCSWTCPECACRLWGGGQTREPKPTTKPPTAAPAPPAPAPPAPAPPAPKPPPAPSTPCTCTCEGDPEYSWEDEKCPAAGQDPKARAAVMARSEPVCRSEVTIESYPVQELVEQVVQSLAGSAGKSVGILGNEDGASYVVQLAAFTDGLFKAGAIVNPVADVGPRSACVVKFPFFTAWAGHEAEYSQFYTGLLEKFSGDKVGKEVYPDAKPDFFGSKGDRSNGANSKAIDDLVSKLKEYFLKEL